MARLFLRMAFILCGFMSHAQQWQWDSSGYTWTSYKFDRLRNLYTWSDSMFTKSLNSSVKWSQPMQNTSIRGIATESDSSVYFIADIHDLAVVGNLTLTADSNGDACVGKIGHNGALSWVKTISSPAALKGVFISVCNNTVVVCGDAAGDVIIGNQTFPKQKVTDPFIATFSSTGNLLAYTSGSTVPYFSSTGSSQSQEVLLDPAANIYFAGKTDFIVKFGSTFITAPHTQSAFIAKFSPSLSVLWHADLPTYYIPVSLRLSKQGELYHLEHLWHFNPNTAFGGIIRSRIVRRSGSGAVLDSAYYNFAPVSQILTICDIDLDTCGNVYFTGNKGFDHHHSINYHVIGAATSALKLMWLRSDSLNWSLRYGNVTALSPGRVMTAGVYTSPAALKNPLIPPPGSIPGSGAYLAEMKASYGLPAITNSALTICDGASVTLNVSSAGFVSWYTLPSGGIPMHNGHSLQTGTLSPGKYTWYAEALTCSVTTARAPVEVTVHPLPVITANSGSVCAVQSFTIIAGGAATYTYPGISNRFTPASTTTYVVTGADIHGCLDTVTASVAVVPGPAINVLGLNQLCENESTELVCTGAQTYTWEHGPNTASVVITPGTSTTYVVHATDSTGCRSSLPFPVRVSFCTGAEGSLLTTRCRIYPNPSADIVSFELPHDADIIVCDASGRNVYNARAGSTFQIDVRSWDPGCYYVKVVTGDDQPYIQKLIVSPQ